MLPWQDRKGAFSALRAGTFVLLFVPAGLIAADYFLGMTTARPEKEALLACGLWGIRILILSLAVRPTQQLLRWAKVMTVRRMIGVAAFFYLLAHFLLHIVDQSFKIGDVFSEIFLRIYLTIGFAALLILAALAATSTDGIVKRLGGKRWRWLHRGAYIAGALAVVHFFLQTRLGATEPIGLGGLFIWLMAYRVIARGNRSQRAAKPWVLLLLTIGVALLTAAAEAGLFYAVRGLDPTKLLEANLGFGKGLRPAWWPLIGGLALLLASSLRKRQAA